MTLSVFRNRAQTKLRVLTTCSSCKWSWYSTKQSSSLVLANSGESHKMELMPEEIVAELDRHVIGQKEAKRAVAIALRNRWRRRHIQNDNLRAEVSPMNILMSGPTGSGKTEIARRLAKMTDSPFLKVEATKYTEVGIYGASAESMIKVCLKCIIRYSQRSFYV